MAQDFGVMGVESAGQSTESREDDLAVGDDEAAAGNPPAAQVKSELGVEVAG